MIDSDLKDLVATFLYSCAFEEEDLPDTKLRKRMRGKWVESRFTEVIGADTESPIYLMRDTEAWYKNLGFKTSIKDHALWICLD